MLICLHVLLNLLMVLKLHLTDGAIKNFSSRHVAMILSWSHSWVAHWWETLLSHYMWVHHSTRHTTRWHHRTTPAPTSSPAHHGHTTCFSLGRRLDRVLRRIRRAGDAHFPLSTSGLNSCFSSLILKMSNASCMHFHIYLSFSLKVANLTPNLSRANQL